MSIVPTFQYRALTPIGELVNGALDAPDLDEVNRRVERLGLIPIEAHRPRSQSSLRTKLPSTSISRPRPHEVTIFTEDLALLLRTGAQINEALELLAVDTDIGRMRPIAATLAVSVLSGESFGEAISRHPKVFPPIYVALVRVGEVSGASALIMILESLAAERQRAEALSRRLSDALRYPAFLLLAAAAVLLFFLLAVLPQFAGVFRDFNAKPDAALLTFLSVSNFLRGNGEAVASLALVIIAASWLLMRRPAVRKGFVGLLARAPVARPILEHHRASLFCRNLSLLLRSGVALTTSLRILSETMQTTGNFIPWSDIVDKVRHGSKLSESLSSANALPPMAIRTIRLGEDSSQLPVLAGRIADVYEAKLLRSLNHTIAFVGPAAIILISIIVGGLIVSVITALLSVNQMVG